MKRIIIENFEFDFDFGCRVLKTKTNECPFPELLDFWDDIKPLSFKDIAAIENVEGRRVALLCYGIDRLMGEVKPRLVNKETINKNTIWVDSDGNLKNHKFSDTYELFAISSEELGLTDRSREFSVYFVKCKDTSTDRIYYIWVDPIGVYNANTSGNTIRWWNDDNEKCINAIQAIAWTIQTNLKVGNIEKIIRQGDCILLKPKNVDLKNDEVRHLSEEEYRKLLVAES